jgi:hypothetical protein
MIPSMAITPSGQKTMPSLFLVSTSQATSVGRHCASHRLGRIRTPTIQLIAMFDYNSQLKQFYASKVKLPTEMRQMLLTHRKSNADRLIKRLSELHWKVRIGDSNFQSQGSFAMDTVIQTRFVAEEYDIDYGVVIRRSQLINDDGSEMSASEARELVRDALKDKRFNRQPKLMTNCVRVFYADEDEYAHHVDIPVYREYEDDCGNTVTDLAGETGWFRSDPKRVNEWLETLVSDKNQVTQGSGSQMRLMVKWMKRFCRSRNSDTETDGDLPNGMKLTMLLAECFQSRIRDDEAFYATLVALRSRLLWNLEIENLADKGWLKPKLTKSTADQNMLNLRARIGEALTQLAVLQSSDCDETKARQAWDWLFKSDGFLKQLEDDAKTEAKKQALQTRATLLATGKGSTDAFGRIACASPILQANAKHAFYAEHF